MVNKPLIRPYFLGGVARIPMILLIRNKIIDSDSCPFCWVRKSKSFARNQKNSKILSPPKKRWRRRIGSKIYNQTNPALKGRWKMFEISNSKGYPRNPTKRSNNPRDWNAVCFFLHFGDFIDFYRSDVATFCTSPRLSNLTWRGNLS